MAGTALQQTSVTDAISLLSFFLSFFLSCSCSCISWRDTPSLNRPHDSHDPDGISRQKDYPPYQHRHHGYFLSALPAEESHDCEHAMHGNAEDGQSNFQREFTLRVSRRSSSSRWSRWLFELRTRI